MRTYPFGGHRALWLRVLLPEAAESEKVRRGREAYARWVIRSAAMRNPDLPDANGLLYYDAQGHRVSDLDPAVRTQWLASDSRRPDWPAPP